MNEQILTIPFVRLRKKTYWYDRTVPGLGRLRMSLRVPSFPKADYMDVWVRTELLETLIRTRQFDLVEALKDGRLDWGKALSAQHHGDLAGLTRELRAAAGMELTLRDAFDLLMDYADSNSDRANTFRNYQSRAEILVEWFGEDTPLSALSVETLQAFIKLPGSDGENGKPVVVRGIGGGPWAPNTQRTYKTTYQQMWELAIAKEKRRAEREKREPMLTSNPWNEVSTRKVSEEVDPLPRSEWRKIAAANEGTLELAAIGSGYVVGLRAAEARWMRYQDFYWEEGQLHLRIYVKRLPDGRVFKPKYGRSRRNIVVPRPFAEMLMVDGKLPKRGWVFGTGGPPTDKAFRELVVLGFERAGVPYGRHLEGGYTHHSGRHACATRMLKAGLSVYAVAKHLGDTEATIVKTYAHVQPTDIGKIVLPALEDL